jgi:hypothetical protein
MRRLDRGLVTEEEWLAIGARPRSPDSPHLAGAVCDASDSIGGVLEMRTECERCHTSLDAQSDARICSYECTFCPACTRELNNVCPNCGGELVTRPRRVL